LDVTPSKYEISVLDTVPILVVLGITTVPVNVGEAKFAFNANSAFTAAPRSDIKLI
jgi:hypothetical protein